MGAFNMRKKVFIIMLFCMAGIMAFGAVEKVKITVASAPSVKNAVEKAADLYMKSNPDTEIKFSYAASGTIQNQIENGADIDIFIAVGGKNMTETENRGFIEKGSRYLIAEDELVCISSKENNEINKLEDLIKKENCIIANGEPGIVPCAKTVEETMSYLGFYEKIKDKFVLCKDLLQVRSYVETGNADGGFVWKSIAIKSNKVKIIFESDEKMHKPVIIEAAVLKEGKNRSRSIDFVKYLTGNMSAEIFKENGFKVKR